MALTNTFRSQDGITGKVAATSLALLKPDLVLARLVRRDFDTEFTGGVGTSVNVKRPLTFAANSRATGAETAITVTTMTEPATQAVSISKMLYSAVAIQDESAAFGIDSFAEQVLAPQATAVGYAIEAEVATLIQTAQAAGLTWGSDYPGALVDARKVLRLHSVPVTNLVCVVAPDVAAGFLKDSKIRDASQSGDSDALRQATIGRVAGMDVVESNLLPAGYGYVFHRDAFALIMRAPAVPDGVAFGDSASAEGFAVRWIQDYDSSALANRSILSTFVGTASFTLTERLSNGSMGTYVPAVKIGGTGS